MKKLFVKPEEGDLFKVFVKEEPGGGELPKFNKAEDFDKPKPKPQPAVVVIEQPTKDKPTMPLPTFEQETKGEDEDEEEEEREEYETEYAIWASFQGSGIRRGRKQPPSSFYAKKDKKEAKELKRVAPRKLDLRASSAVFHDKLGRSYHLPERPRDDYARDTILKAMEPYDGDATYAFYWVKLPPKSHHYPNLGDVLDVKTPNGTTLEAQIVKVQTDKDRRPGQRSTSWVVIRIS
jgi:hypothetical protein